MLNQGDFERTAPWTTPIPSFYLRVGSLSSVSMEENAARKPYRGSCHCGMIRYVVSLVLPPANLDLDTSCGTSIRMYECHCSTCLKLGMFHLRLEDSPNDFVVLSPLTFEEPGVLGDYRTFAGEYHWYFCSNCGVRCFGFAGTDGKGAILDILAVTAILDILAVPATLNILAALNLLATSPTAPTIPAAIAASTAAAATAASAHAVSNILTALAAAAITALAAAAILAVLAARTFLVLPSLPSQLLQSSQSTQSSQSSMGKKKCEYGVSSCKGVGKRCGVTLWGSAVG
jgi:hypothetical protein